MTHEGVKSLFKVMLAAYPNFHPADIQSAITVWERLLRDDNDADVARALEMYILNDTKGFAPSIGQIKEMMAQKPNELTELEAWGLVNKAIRNGNYGAAEEFAKLPDTVRSAIGSPKQIEEWASMPIDSVQTVAQSNFLRSYRDVCEREKKADKMPENIKALFRKDAPMIETKEEIEESYEGVPMPDEIRKKFEEMGMKP